MYDPHNGKFVPLDEQTAKAFDDPNVTLTETQKVQREWTRFAEGETIEVKGIKFRVDEIGEQRLVLKPINKAEFAEKTARR